MENLEETGPNISEWLGKHIRDILLIVVFVLQGYTSLTQNDNIILSRQEQNTKSIEKLQNDIDYINQTRYTFKDAENLSNNIQLQYNNLQLQLNNIGNNMKDIKDDIKEMRTENLK